MNFVQLHMLVNHYSLFGTAFGALALIWAIFSGSREMRWAAIGLFLTSGAFFWGALYTGEGAREIAESLPGVTETHLAAHASAADAAKFPMILLAVCALALNYLRGCYRHLLKYVQGIALVLALTSFGFLVRTAHQGGEIRHSEVRTGDDNQSESLNNDLPASSPLDKAEWEKMRWIDKASQVLRGQEGLSQSDNIDRLLTLPKPEIVDLFMQDPRFIDTVLKFNLYFLGYEEQLRDHEGSYREAIYDFPHAITSAVATALNKNYLSLLRFDQPFYSAPIVNAENVEFKTTALAQWDKIKDEIEIGLPKNKKEVCRLWMNGGATNPVFHLLDKWAISKRLAYELHSDRNWFGDLTSYCIPLDQSKELALNMPLLKSIRPRFVALLKYLEDFDSSKYSPKTLNQMTTLSDEYMQWAIKPGALNTAFWFAFINSNTNFSRKRASYILKRYFCDDLFPINIAMTDKGKKHGTSASCTVCHYKLDPMAGFFKDRGSNGINYASYKDYVFDTPVTQNREEYQKAWLSESGKWDIGFIRSAERTEKNEYGTTLKDLSSIIQRAPEVKRCLVRRSFEFFINEHQAVDPSYLAQLEKVFAKYDENRSALAFKEIVKTLVLSKSFEPIDRDLSICTEGNNPDSENRPPCQIYSLLTKNCTSCHGDVKTKGRLNLEHWLVQTDGTFSFPHKDTFGQQVPTAKTLQSLKERLTSSSSKDRMPLLKYMEGAEREALIHWVQSRIELGISTAKRED